MSEAFGPVSRRRHEDAAVVTLDQPDRLNPLSDAMRAGLLAALEAAIADDGVRAIILTGAGGNFTAGADIRQMQGDDGPDPVRARRRLIVLQRCVELIAAGPKPVVAALEGAVFGAGLAMAAACDFVIAGEGVKLGAAFGKIGLTADCGLAWSLPQRVGRTLARDLMFTGRVLKAQEAQALGIADRLVPAGGALDAALAKAAEYRSVAPLAIAAMKTALAQGPGPLADTLALELQQQPMLLMTRDHLEGTAAFFEKRVPVFIGR